MTPHDDAASNGPIHTAARALTSRLKAIFPEERFQHELLPAPLSAEELGVLASVRAPLVGLFFIGMKPGSTSRALQAKLNWGVYLVTGNPKSGPRLLGDSLAPGLAQMVHAAIIGLHGWVIGGAGDGGVGTVAVGDAQNIDGSAWKKEHHACASLAVDVEATFTAALPDQLKTLAGQWTFDGETVAAADTAQGNQE